MSTEMNTTIGEYNSETKQVEVTFEHAGVTFTRGVNAVLSEGEYDAPATAARVEEVARGVKYKIDNGVITNTPPAVAAPPENPAQIPAE